MVVIEHLTVIVIGHVFHITFDCYHHILEYHPHHRCPDYDHPYIHNPGQDDDRQS